MGFINDMERVQYKLKTQSVYTGWPTSGFNEIHLTLQLNTSLFTTNH
jgi:hypothetical protein